MIIREDGMPLELAAKMLTSVPCELTLMLDITPINALEPAHKLFKTSTKN